MTSLARNLGNLGNVLSQSGLYAAMAATPPISDSSANLATTAFVKRSGITFGSFNTISATTTLSVSSVGQAYLVSAGSIILTLPSIAQLSAGAAIAIINWSGNSFTLKGNGSDLIATPNSLTGTNTVNIYPGEALVVGVYGSRWNTIHYDQLGSPSFSGAPKLLTAPSQFDNSTAIPNTIWVNGRGSSYSGSSNNASASTTLTVATIGSIQNFTLLGAQTVTLPPTASILAGSMLSLVKYGTNYSTHNLTVSTNASASIITLPGGTTVSSMIVEPGETLDLTWDGTNWKPSGARLVRTALYKVGEVKMWHGAVASIAATWGPGWQLADGSYGTANLIDRFIVGAGGGYPVNTTGGNITNTLSVAQLPAHTHGVTDPTHGHAIADPTHGHSVSDPGHAHSMQLWYNSGVTANSRISESYVQTQGDVVSVNASATGIGIYSASVGIGIYASATGVSIQSTGSGGAIENRPPYYSLCFIEYTGLNT